MSYSNDLTDDQWELLEPVFNVPGKRGRRHAKDLLKVVDAMLYIAQTGCQWRIATTLRHLSRERTAGAQWDSQPDRTPPRKRAECRMSRRQTRRGPAPHLTYLSRDRRFWNGCVRYDAATCSR